MAVVVGHANSPLGRAAIDRAVEEASLRQVPLVLVGHVPRPRSEQAASEYPGSRTELEQLVQREAAALSQRGVACVPVVPRKPTTAAEALMEAAEEHDADLIVLGIPRRSPVGKLVMGSTAQEVLLGAPCPVLGVKAPAEEAGHR